MRVDSGASLGRRDRPNVDGGFGKASAPGAGPSRDPAAAQEAGKSCVEACLPLLGVTQSRQRIGDCSRRAHECELARPGFVLSTEAMSERAPFPGWPGLYAGGSGGTDGMC